MRFLIHLTTLAVGAATAMFSPSLLAEPPQPQPDSSLGDPGRVFVGASLVSAGHGTSLTGLMFLLQSIDMCDQPGSPAVVAVAERYSNCDDYQPFMIGGSVALLAGGAAMAAIGGIMIFNGAAPGEVGETDGDPGSVLPAIELSLGSIEASWKF